MAATALWKRVVPTALVFVALAGSAEPASVEASAPRPDIVVIYIDDFSSSVARLWSSSRRTPALARFVDHGVRLRASGSTPLCCPARANLLTGRYGHRNGVTRNGIGGYDPGSTIAVKLARVGYHTAFVGKFLNGLRDAAPTARSVRRFGQGWRDFDVIWGNQGRFYGYTLWTRQGTTRHGRQPRDHSSRIVGLRAARHILRAPRQRPLFMVVSLFDGHEPHRPMAAFAGHPACRGVGSIADPSFAERDVSDKPRYVRSRHFIRRKAASLVRPCEEIMTVDWVAQRIRAALARTGRLNDTLLLFTADNGTLMGEHRLSGKQYPYATPVPMYALWPKRWGEEARAVRDPVSNVDLAPTFCRLAGCVMRGADGRNIMPLLDGSVEHLDRRFIYEEMLHPGARKIGRPAWYGIRTTLGYSDKRWVYTEYASRERELYDLTNDPHQLENLAGRPAHAEVESELRRMLHEEVVGPHRVRFSRVRS